jgi:plasmid stabilization system protein ParE
LAYRVLYSRRAERDLDRLAAATTADWYDGLIDAIETLEQFPERCPLSPESSLRRRRVRQLLYGEGRNIYRVLYYVREETVQLLTIRHTHRKPLG